VAVDVRVCGLVRCRRCGQARILIRSRIALIVAAAWIVFGFPDRDDLHVAFLESLVPKWMIKAIYPIDKTDLDMLRFHPLPRLGASGCAISAAFIGRRLIPNGCVR